MYNVKIYIKWFNFSVIYLKLFTFLAILLCFD